MSFEFDDGGLLVIKSILDAIIEDSSNDKFLAETNDSYFWGSGCIMEISMYSWDFLRGLTHIS